MIKIENGIVKFYFRDRKTDVATKREGISGRRGESRYQCGRFCDGERIPRSPARVPARCGTGKANAPEAVAEALKAAGASGDMVELTSTSQSQAMVRRPRRERSKSSIKS
jgi:hypothetical protein